MEEHQIDQAAASLRDTLVERGHILDEPQLTLLHDVVALFTTVLQEGDEMFNNIEESIEEIIKPEAVEKLQRSIDRAKSEMLLSATMDILEVLHEVSHGDKIECPTPAGTSKEQDD